MYSKGRSITRWSPPRGAAAASCGRSASRPRSSRKRSPRSCATPRTRTTGAPPAAPRVRSGWRRSTTPTTTPPNASHAQATHSAALPALDEAMSNGELSLDQAARRRRGRDAGDRRRARRASRSARPPAAIARAARLLVPPTLVDDVELYRRRALRMTWTSGDRELKFSGSLPLEQGVAFEQAIWEIAKPLRALDKRSGTPVLEWSQYCADALVTLATQPSRGDDDGVRRSPTTVIVHLSEDGTPPFIEGSGPISPETAERLCCDARRLVIKPHGGDLVHSRVDALRLLRADARALQARRWPLPVPRLQRQPRAPRPPHHPRRRTAARPCSTT